jgi:hypothetical protein
MTLVIGRRTFQDSLRFRRSALLRSDSRSSVRLEDAFSLSDRGLCQFNAFNRLAMRPFYSFTPQHDARKMVVSKHICLFLMRQTFFFSAKVGSGLKTPGLSRTVAAEVRAGGLSAYNERLSLG